MTDQLVDIGQVIVHGVMFDPKNSQAWRKVDFAQNILQSVPKLFDVLEERGIDYVLVGGITMLAYVDGRNTQDISWIVVQADLDTLPELRIEDRNQDFARWPVRRLADRLPVHQRKAVRCDTPAICDQESICRTTRDMRDGRRPATHEAICAAGYISAWPIRSRETLRKGRCGLD
ncbi:MAG: hypothetical protein AB7G28_18440 [Pirellulales bacterium]